MKEEEKNEEASGLDSRRKREEKEEKETWENVSRDDRGEADWNTRNG